MTVDEALDHFADRAAETVANALANGVEAGTLTAKKAAEIEKTLALFRQGFGAANGLFAYVTALGVDPKKAEAAIVGLDPEIELVKLGANRG